MGRKQSAGPPAGVGVAPTAQTLADRNRRRGGRARPSICGLRGGARRPVRPHVDRSERGGERLLSIPGDRPSRANGTGPVPLRRPARTDQGPRMSAGRLVARLRRLRSSPSWAWGRSTRPSTKGSPLPPCRRSDPRSPRPRPARARLRRGGRVRLPVGLGPVGTRSERGDGQRPARDRDLCPRCGRRSDLGRRERHRGAAVRSRRARRRDGRTGIRPARRLEMGERSSSKIRGFEPQTWAEGMREAVLTNAPRGAVR